jgi:hypothetical protein
MSGVQYHALRSTLMSAGKFPGGIWIKYRCGFKEDEIPTAVVGLIESMAAYQFLSVMGPILFPHTSTGISIDGVSQSVGSLGPNFLNKRLDDLAKLIEMQKEAMRTQYQRGLLIDYL